MSASAAGGRPRAGRPGDLRAPRDEWDETLVALGYTWCRPCAEWHRPPECWVDERGVPALDLELRDAWTAETVPPKLLAIIDARAGRQHSRTGSVAATLAEILNAYDQNRFRS